MLHHFPWSDPKWDVSSCLIKGFSDNHHYIPESWVFKVLAWIAVATSRIFTKESTNSSSMINKHKNYKMSQYIIYNIYEFLDPYTTATRIARYNIFTKRITKFYFLVFLEIQIIFKGQGLIKIVKEIPTLINENDLQISLLSFKFITGEP